MRWFCWRSSAFIGGQDGFIRFPAACVLLSAANDELGKWQAKGSAAFTPSPRVPLTLTANYGRGINSIDACGVVQRPASPRLGATDFYEAASPPVSAVSASTRTSS